MTPPKQGTISGVVFDFDGTLIDSAPDLMFSVNKILKTAGRRAVTLGEVQGMIGDGMPVLLERSFRATGDLPEEGALKAYTQRFIENYSGADAKPDHLYPGVAETLQSLKQQGYTLGLCTNKPIAPTLAILRKLKIERFFSAISGGNSIPGIRKPDPRHLLAVIDELGLRPDQAVMIGDKEHDINCAKGAKVRSIIVSFGYANGPIEDIGADAIIDHLLETADAVARLA